MLRWGPWRRGSRQRAAGGGHLHRPRQRPASTGAASQQAQQRPLSTKRCFEQLARLERWGISWWHVLRMSSTRAPVDRLGLSSSPEQAWDRCIRCCIHPASNPLPLPNAQRADEDRCPWPAQSTATPGLIDSISPKQTASSGAGVAMLRWDRLTGAARTPAARGRRPSRARPLPVHCSAQDVNRDVRSRAVVAPVREGPKHAAASMPDGPPLPLSWVGTGAEATPRAAPPPAEQRRQGGSPSGSLDPHDLMGSVREYW